MLKARLSGSIRASSVFNYSLEGSSVLALKSLGLGKLAFFKLAGGARNGSAPVFGLGDNIEPGSDGRINDAPKLDL